MVRRKEDATPLREGFTTGTAAAAAAKAATLLLLTGEAARTMNTPLPPGGRLVVPVESVALESAAPEEAGETMQDAPTGTTQEARQGSRPDAPIANPPADVPPRLAPASARARVIKDGGDDPDATHGHAIEAVVALHPFHETGSAFPPHDSSTGPDDAKNETGYDDAPPPPAPGRLCPPAPDAPADVTLFGGQGVGLATLPGLPIAPGEPAINPEPRRQIAVAVAEALAEADFRGHAAVTIEVPDGKAVAAKTMNPRLGITDGISILGTRGTVKPFSHESYAASIRQALDVARAQGHAHVALTTGGRTEGLVRADLPGLADTACVQFADFFALALAEAAARGFAAVTVGCYFGKLVKMAQGFEYTHAKDARIDFERLARWFEAAGVAHRRVEQVRAANTARHALEIAWDDPAKNAMLEAVTAKALAAARQFAGPGPALDYRVYAFDGSPLIHRKGD